MVTLEQIRNLEAKVQRAVAYIGELKKENALLKKTLEKYRTRIDELEVSINEYKEDQNAIEEGIKNALLHLDKLEDTIAKSPAAHTAPPASPPPKDIEELEDIEGEPLEPAMEVDAEPPAPAKTKDELDIF
jgi:chromosome segregation ATPase